MELEGLMSVSNFEYGDKEIEYLKRKDRRLGEAIEKIGHIYREADDDLFSSVVHNIVGQQISSAALSTVWTRLKEKLHDVNAETVCAASREDLQYRFNTSEYSSFAR